MTLTFTSELFKCIRCFFPTPVLQQTLLVIGILKNRTNISCTECPNSQLLTTVFKVAQEFWEGWVFNHSTYLYLSIAKQE